MMFCWHQLLAGVLDHPGDATTAVRRYPSKKMTNKKQIRPARKDDLRGVMDIVRAVIPVMQASGNFQWSEAYPTEDVFAADIAENRLFVVECNDRLVAMAAFTEDQYAEYSSLGWDLTQRALVVHRMAVHPEFQGEGIAYGLMVASEEEALRRGIVLLRCDTNSKNQPMNHLFLKLKYKHAGTFSLRGPDLFNGYEKVLTKF